MKTISYTQMRSELSDILDAIRNGESITVTQRGRPATIINGKTIFESKQDNLTEVKGGEQPQKPTELAQTARAAQTVTHHYPKDLQSFQEALKHTQQKHKKIIKALEDK